jgi:sporulation protein YlmC with PRC-barrel domain
MKKTLMITDLQEKEVLSSEGARLGYVSNVVVDTSTGKVVHLLVEPYGDEDEEVIRKKYRIDSMGRIVLPFNKVKSARDVVVMAPLKEK